MVKTMRLEPRQIIQWFPVLAPAFLIILWIALALWSGGIRSETDALRRQLQSVRMEKPVLQSIQADRNARLAATDSQNRQSFVYAVMEDALRAAGLGDNVRQLRPESRELDLHVEERLSLNITQLDPPQFARFLYETRKALPEMTVDSLSMRRNSNGFMDIDAVFLVRRAK